MPAARSPQQNPAPATTGLRTVRHGGPAIQAAATDDLGQSLTQARRSRSQGPEITRIPDTDPSWVAHVRLLVVGPDPLVVVDGRVGRSQGEGAQFSAKECVRDLTRQAPPRPLANDVGQRAG